MLTSLTLRSVATYPAEGVTLAGLQPISFIFGSNSRWWSHGYPFLESYNF